MAHFALYAFAGAVPALAVLLLHWRLAPKTIFETANIGLGIIVAIYVGARLATGDVRAILIEVAIACAFMAAGLLSRRIWPAGVGFALAAHGIYDLLAGEAAGLPGWYPPFCLGVDLALGAGLIVIGTRKHRGVLTQ
ncbi:hypothetical protein ACI5KX_06325 [Erythrobacter sp. GH1-10]|uniref:hypothetical protein n=1 Tax=Erythrobacter sp. GH1-10 TaxID=3349334 RepID=UPI003877B0E1